MAGPEDVTPVTSHSHHHHHHHAGGTGHPDSHSQRADLFVVEGDDITADQTNVTVVDRLHDDLKAVRRSSVELSLQPDVDNDNMRIDLRNRRKVGTTGLACEVPAGSAKTCRLRETSAESERDVSETSPRDTTDESMRLSSDHSERKVSQYSTHSEQSSSVFESEDQDGIFYLDEDDNENNAGDIQNRNDDQYEYFSSQDELSDLEDDGLDNDDLGDDDLDDRLNDDEVAESLQRTLVPTDSPVVQGTNLNNPSAETFSDNKTDTGFQAAGGQEPPKSAPRPIPRRPLLRRWSSSSMHTVCRTSQSSQLVVRCQMNNSQHLTAASCPAHFSPKWTDVIKFRRKTDGAGDEPNQERRRRYTVGSKAPPLDLQQQQTRGGLRQRQRLGPGPGPQPRLQDDPRQPGFTGRSRSYSEADVQTLLMREVGQELRKISDQFNFDCLNRVKLTTVRESPKEDWDHAV